MAQRITEADIRSSLNLKKTIVQIGRDYEVAPITVLKMIQKMEKDDRTFKVERPKQFDLRIGDVFTAIESEISSEKNEYVVIYIDDVKYIGKKISGLGKWKAAFLISDYGTRHDPCHVQRRRKEGTSGEWKKSKDIE